MHEETFIIIFEDGEQIKETAWSLEEAKILAQAERIKHGKSYAIKSWAMAEWAMAEKQRHYSNCEGYCDTCSWQHVCQD